MASADVKISFLCRNYRCSYVKGRLKLPLSFSLGSQLPNQVFLHVPSGAIWCGQVSKDKNYITGLEEMMDFHNVTPNHVVIFEYKGGCNLNVEIYNPYCVEIDYTFNHTMRLTPSPHFEAGKDDVYYADVETAKLSECFRYNAYYNFSGLYNLLIQPNHLNEGCHTKVLPRAACLKLGINESVHCIEVGFRNFKWPINLNWLNDEAYLEKGWIQFLEECRTAVGDVVVFSKKLSSTSFRVVFFSQTLGATSSYSDEGSSTNPKFCKLMKRSTIESAELEVPLVFMKNYGQDLSRAIVEVDLGVGYVMNFKFCPATHTMFGLTRFMRKFKISCNYMLFFTYKGGSKFSMRVFDYLCFDSMRDNEGVLTLEEFVLPTDGSYFINLSTISGTLLEDSNEEESEVNSYCTVLPIPIEDDQIADERNSPSSPIQPIEIEDDDILDVELDVTEHDSEGNLENINADSRSFNVILKKSHLNHRCRGVYIPSTLIKDYQT